MRNRQQVRKHGAWLFGLACVVLVGCGGGDGDARSFDQSVDDEPLGWMNNGWMNNGWMNNGWMNNGWMNNGFHGNEFTENAFMGNAANLDYIVGHALDEVTINVPAINNALTNPQSRDFFQYLYSCAAPAGTTLVYQNLSDPTDTYEFVGNGGLGESSRWATDHGGFCDDECNRLVTACLAARANKYGIHVPMSLRGDAPFLYNMAREIPGYGYAKGTDDAVPSGLDCGSPTSGTNRNCSWRPALIGWCAGGTITVAAGCNGIGSASGDTMLRVCKDAHLCDNASADWLGANDSGGGTCGVNPSVDINCPAGGMYFNVMWGSYSSADVASVASPGVKVKSPGATVVYPAPEGATSADKAVFWVREGAFYGRALGSKYMHPGRQKCQYSVIGGKLVSPCQPNFDPGESRLPYVYSCTAPGWSNALAYWEDRQCSGGTCWSNYTGSCNSVCATGNYSTDPTTGIGLYDYNHCMGGGKVHDYAITDFVPDRSEQCPPYSSPTVPNKCAGNGDGIGGGAKYQYP